MHEMGEMGLVPKLKFPLNLFIDFSEIVPDQMHWKVGMGKINCLDF